LLRASVTSDGLFESESRVFCGGEGGELG